MKEPRNSRAEPLTHTIFSLCKIIVLMVLIEFFIFRLYWRSPIAVPIAPEFALFFYNFITLLMILFLILIIFFKNEFRTPLTGALSPRPPRFSALCTFFLIVLAIHLVYSDKFSAVFYISVLFLLILFLLIFSELHIYLKTVFILIFASVYYNSLAFQLQSFFSLSFYNEFLIIGEFLAAIGIPLYLLTAKYGNMEIWKYGNNSHTLIFSYPHILISTSITLIFGIAYLRMPGAFSAIALYTLNFMLNFPILIYLTGLWVLLFWYYDYVFLLIKKRKIVVPLYSGLLLIFLGGKRIDVDPYYGLVTISGLIILTLKSKN